jgi:hypothetical protein
MLCEKCHKREATVHLTSNVPTETLTDHPELRGLVGHRDLCDVCFPFGSMSEEEREATLRELFGAPTADEGSKPGEDT